MFVKISLTYEWFGKHVDEAFVGPFDTATSAWSWRVRFQKVISTRKLIGETKLVVKTNTQKTQFPPEKTPDEVYIQMNENLYKACIG